MGDRRGAHRISVKRPEEKRPLGSVWHRCEYNIQKNIQEVGWRHGLN
jgi:hypothetical protein